MKKNIIILASLLTIVISISIISGEIFVKKSSIIPDIYITETLSGQTLTQESTSANPCNLTVSLTDTPTPPPPSGACKPSVTFSDNIWLNGTNPVTVADVNGDGKADKINFSDDGVKVGLSTGTKFSTASVWISSFNKKNGWTDQNIYPRMMADVNGDGKADIVGFGSKATYVSLSTGNSFSSPKSWIANYGVSAGGWANQTTVPRLLADVNGDCKADIVGFGNKATYVSLSTGSSFATQTSWIASFGVNAGGWTSQITLPRLLADVNGDGKADIVGFGTKATNVSLSTGSSFAASKSWISNFGVSAGGWTDQNLYPRLLGLNNKDSKADIYAFSKKGVYQSLNIGTAFASPTLSINSFTTESGAWESMTKYPRLIADVNGDNYYDIIGFGNSAVYVSTNTGSKFNTQVSWGSK